MTDIKKIAAEMRLAAPKESADRLAYEGAREDLLDWKRRALKAEAALAAAQARIAELEASQQWQPIETAPKNGTRILTYSPKDNEYCWKIEINKWKHSAWQASPSMCQPTHWMPLPAPPALTGEPR